MDINNISIQLKERFCKDCNIPFTLYQEPYFTDRLKLYDNQFKALKKWDVFKHELLQYQTEQDYFEEYNKVKDSAINFIKSTKAYNDFNNEDMNKYKINHNNLPSNDIYKPTNNGRIFISIDMNKANFSSLYNYSPYIFDCKVSWEDFIRKFTNNEHIVNSKYIRQVILGNCNPKKHITYEKYLMDIVLSIVLNNFALKDNIVFFSNDEIIFDVTVLDTFFVLECYSKLESLFNALSIPLKREIFQLYKLEPGIGYIKNDCITNQNKIKCVNNYMMPFVIRYLNNEPISTNDKVFYHNGLLSEFIDTPLIEVNKNEI